MVTVFGLVAAVVPTVVSAATATDQITAMTMPTQGRGNLALDTSIVALSQAADGTLFAGVRDDSGAVRWPVAQGNRLYAVFTSTNGYDWTEGFKIPWDDNISSASGNDPIIAIAPVPDYSSNNSIVYMATEKFVYVSANGGKTFTRIDAVPGVTYNNEITDITSLDVVANPSPATGYVVVVGTTGGLNASTASGVFTYNEGGVPMWRDKMIGNDVYTTNSYDVYAVKFSAGYTASNDKVLLAVYATNSSTSGVLTIRGTLGAWGVETLDAAIPVSVTAAKIALPADYNWISNPVSYVKTATNVYKITSIQSPGAPTVRDLAFPITSYIEDIAVSGSGSSTQALVAAFDGNNGVQVFKGTGISIYAPAWTPSYKQPIGDGSYGAYLAVGITGTFVAANGNGPTPSGVSKLVAGAAGMAWNGVGLIDTIIATRQYFGNPMTGGPVWVEASPNNKVDNTVFMVTNADDQPICVWRTSDGGTTWDLVNVGRLSIAMGNADINYATDDLADQIIDPEDVWADSDSSDLLSVRTSPTFSNSVNSTSQVVFMLGNKVAANGSVIGEWLFKSYDAGNTWAPIIAMPNHGSSSFLATAWCVVNDNTVLLGDDSGYVYKTTDNGFSWTDGSLTSGTDGTITSLKYYNATTGLIVLAGISQVWNTDVNNLVQVWISTDGAASFTQVGTSLATILIGDYSSYTPVMVDFDNNWNTNHMIYAAFGGTFDTWNYINGSWTKALQQAAGVWRSPVVVSDPTSSIWTTIVNTGDFAGMVPAEVANTSIITTTSRDLWPTALEVGPENTIYVPIVFYDEALGVNTWGGFIRCLDGTAASTKWDFTDTSLPGYGGLWTASIVAGSNNIFTIGYRYDDSVVGEGEGTTTNGLIDLRLLNYVDTLASKAGGMVPASGAKGVGTISNGMANVPLTWGNLSGTSYKWQIALDSTFDNIVKEGIASSSTATATGLALGTTYYWRVKAIEPAEGPWSSAVSFTTASTVSGAPILTSPANGATISETKPLFTWTSVAGATSYKIQIATDAAFTSITKEATSASAFYAATDKLSNGVYYWRVQATVGSDTTAWGSGAFTVGAATTSSTPAWVWVLIVLGVVLAIFVLVLILRTRRPV